MIEQPHDISYPPVEPEYMDMSDMMFRCKLGGLSNRLQTKQSEAECMCDQSCEPHIHLKDGILCLHDGENGHEHCPVNRG